MKLSITCDCGHKVLANEILDTGFFFSHGELVGLYVRYKCHKCGALREQSFHHPSGTAITERAAVRAVPRRRRVPAGPISTAEVRAFEGMLYGLDDELLLSYLRATTHFPRRRRRRRRPAD